MNERILNDWFTKKNLTKEQINKLNLIFSFIDNKYPQLTLEIKWNEPMYKINNSFVISISITKNHISIAPEKYALNIFKDLILSNNYECSSNLFKIKNQQEINLDLFSKIIDFKIEDKKDSLTYFK